MKAANLFGRFFTPPEGLDKSFVKGSIGAETEEELRTGDTESAVFYRLGSDQANQLKIYNKVIKKG